MTPSEESMILMTSYRFPPTVTDPSRSLRMTLNIPPYYNVLPFGVIQHF